MSSIASPEARSARCDARGFALVLTVALLAFLVLLLVSLSALARVETQVAGNAQQLAEARQNALMALNIALGQLQKYAGPDQRVTAGADVLAGYEGHPALPTSPAGNADAQAQIDAFWSDRRNRHWTGVWKNGNASLYDAAAPAAFNAAPELQSWLVSGNEQGTTAFRPDGRVDALAAGATALDEITDASNRVYRLLVGPGSTTVTDPAKDLHRYVTAPQVEIKSGGVPGVAGAMTTGHYAWWIGDEGVKARANLRDPYAEDTGEPALVRNRKRLQSAQRVAIEAMVPATSDAGGLAAYPANAHALDNIVAAPQLGFLSADSAYRTALKARFHDLTASSRGVLADAKHGGLKHDLSYLLGRPSLTEFRTALNKALPGAAPRGDYNPILSPASTPYATRPDAAFAGMLDYSATWEQLWSFHNLAQAGFDSSGRAIPRPHTATQHGLYPLLVQGKLFYNLRQATDGTVWIDIVPIVVLANPYDVDLAPADYYLEISGMPLLLQKSKPTSSPKSAFNTGRVSYERVLTNGALQQTELVIRAPVLPRGEARVFTVSREHNALVSDPELDLVVIDGSASRVYLSSGDDGQTALTLSTGVVLEAATGGLAHDEMARLCIPDNKADLPRLGLPLWELRFRLYLDPDLTKLANLAHQGLRLLPASATTPPLGNFSAKMMVGPLQRGGARMLGGGIYFSYFDGTGHTPNFRQYGNAAQGMLRDKQAIFYQGNLRALLNEQHGTGGAPFAFADAAYTEVKHPPVYTQENTWTNYQWRDAFVSDPDAGAFKDGVRWGLAFLGKGRATSDTSAGLAQALPPPDGFDQPGGNQSDRAILYDVPRPEQPLVSVGQLQHFNATGHLDGVTTIGRAQTVHTWQANYPIGNSYPHPRVPRDQVFEAENYDGSFLWNDVFWDRFTFTSYPATGSFDIDDGALINARYRPFRARSEVSWADETAFRGDSRSGAKNLLVDGAFNLNSTSVEAWKAVLAGLRNVPIGTDTAANAPFARTLARPGGAMNAEDGVSANAWTGYRDLSPAELEALAGELVMQVRRRSPFLSLADFVNRRLASKATDSAGLGLGSALQSALDATVNPADNVGSTGGYPFGTQTAAGQLAEDAYRLPSRIAGFPGYLLQGDVLSALAPTLAARSDTFVIRAYGDVVNATASTASATRPEIMARAWCEAVVQRLPDYIEPKVGSSGNAPEEVGGALTATNQTYGRRFQVVSFRWLTADDI